MKDDTKKILMSIGIFFIVISIGSYIMWTMKDEIENHPEITEIGGPPVITDIRPMFVLVVITTIILLVILWVKKEGAKNE